MAILINIKKRAKSNVIYLDDYLKKKSGIDISWADEVDRQIILHKKETDIIDREIAEYEAEAEKSAKELKTKLYYAGDNDGKDQLL